MVDWLLKLDKSLAPYDVGHVADWIGILSLAVTVIGFVVTILGVISSKRAAEQARDAAYRAVKNVALTNVISELGQVVVLVEQARQLHRTEQWNHLPDILTEMRKRLILVKTSNADLPQDLVQRVDGIVRVCGEREDAILRFIKTAPKPGALNFANDAMRVLQDQVHELSSEVTNSVGVV